MLPEAVTDADTVLIDGPYLTGKRRLFHSVLRSWTEEPVVASTRHIDERVRRIHEQATGGTREELTVVDCVSAPHVDDPDETDRTRYAAGPGNLTSIGTTVTDVLESRRDDDLAVGVTSVSPLLMYHSPRTVFQFVKVLVRQTTGQGWSMAAVTQSTAHDGPDHHALRELFDVLIETRRQPVDASDAEAVTGAEAATDAADEPVFRARSPTTATDWAPVSSV